VQGTQQEYEGFIGCKILKQIKIYPPNDIYLKERNKRIKRAKELSKSRKGKNVKKEESLT
jgi:hypothetical protein